MKTILNTLADWLYNRSSAHDRVNRRLEHLENELAATLSVLDRIGPRSAAPEPGRHLASVSPIRSSVKL